ncbi:MAG: putative Response regulator/sensory box histidine kinase [Planctomycetaceae bacterium]|nr:putative Response regulator/sensory box histidine kinase [Planctomycetaceae bacterium]
MLLSAIFGVEFVVMLVLPTLLPANSSLGYTALVDACSLTAILAPVIWVLVVRPLRRVAEFRLRLFALILAAQEEERGRIARDLHDELGQSLTRLLVGLRTIQESSTEDGVCQLAHDLRRIGADTHEEVRRMARGLRPLVLDDMGLVPALERLFEVVAVHDVDARMDELSRVLPRLPPAIETVLYRIAQEALSNAVRHGAPSEIRLQLQESPDAILLSVRDNGCGFDVASILQKTTKSNSFGLIGMRERAALCEGTVNIQSHPGSGSLIEVRIPIPRNKDAHGENSNHRC